MEREVVEEEVVEEEEEVVEEEVVEEVVEEEVVEEEVVEEEVVEEELRELALMELELESVIGPLDVVKGSVELMLVYGIGTLEVVAVVEEPRTGTGLLELRTLEPAIMELDMIPALVPES